MNGVSLQFKIWWINKYKIQLELLMVWECVMIVCEHRNVQIVIQDGNRSNWIIAISLVTIWCHRCLVFVLISFQINCGTRLVWKADIFLFNKSNVRPLSKLNQLNFKFNSILSPLEIWYFFFSLFCKASAMILLSSMWHQKSAKHR